MPSSKFAAACLRHPALWALVSLCLISSPFASAGDALTISGTPPTTASVGSSYSFQPRASDPSGLKVTFRIYNKPSWASFDTATGRLYGTPGAGNVGSYRWIQIAGSDGKITSWLPAYTLTVSAASTSTSGGGTTAGARLIISGTPPATATVGAAYSFQPKTTVPSGTTATFKIYNRPSWANFDGATGRLYGTPGADNVGSYRWVQIEAIDGGATSWLPAYTLTVSAAPTSSGGGGTTAGAKLIISGTPSGTATVGTAYSFQPTATVPSGTTATFKIYNKPSWAIFNSTTGRLYGTPTASDVGTYRWIQIEAVDGRSTSWLPAYTLTVSAGASSSGTVTVAWMPPTENTDGSTLTNLAGYHLYYGTSQSRLDHVVNITNPGLTSYVLSGLSATTWYFAMASITASGVEGPRSAVVSHVVR